MSAEAFLDEMGELGIVISANGGSLDVESPRGLMTQEVMQKCKELKSEILLFLNEKHLSIFLQNLPDITFNSDMLFLGLKLWKEPLNEDEIKGVLSGCLTKDIIFKKLLLWTRCNQEKYSHLVAAVNGCESTSPKFNSYEVLISRGVPIEGNYEYLKKHLSIIPNSQRVNWLNRYADIYFEAIAQEPLDYKRPNVGCRAANIWARTNLEI
ncbi:MAG: hypothetical protein P8I03_09095 [Thalassotalea sp.]|nr:hypothetical protein [Thalassotalea sp.]